MQPIPPVTRASLRFASLYGMALVWAVLVRCAGTDAGGVNNYYILLLILLSCLAWLPHGHPPDGRLCNFHDAPNGLSTAASPKL